MKCGYKDCSRQCSGDVNDENCKLLKAYHQGKADGGTEAVKEFARLVAKKLSYCNDEEKGAETASYIYKLAKRFIKRKKDAQQFKTLTEINNSEYKAWLHKYVLVTSETSRHEGEVGEIVGITKTMHYLKVRLDDGTVNLSPLSIKLLE